MTEDPEPPADRPGTETSPAPARGPKAVPRSPANDNPRKRSDAAVDEWENEGGHFPHLPPVGIDPTDVSPRPSARSERAGLAEMRARFESDFIRGLMRPTSK